MFKLLLLLFSLNLFAGDGSYAVVLQYHRIGESKYPSTNTSKALFEKHLAYLQKHNFHVLTLSDVIDKLKNHKPLPSKTAVITIDDAYISVYKNGYPLLQKYHFPATIFVNSAPILHHSKSFMTLDQMREMGKSGSEFANHTHTHQYLARYDDANLVKKVTQEILRCETFLEENLQPYLSKYKMVAYPFGEYDVRVIGVMKKLGYIGVAQNSGAIDEHSNFMALTRFPMATRFGGMKSFALKVNTKPLPIESIDKEDTFVTRENNPPQLNVTLQKSLQGINCFTSNGERIPLEKISALQFHIEAKKPLHYPRDHYTCTARAKDGSWYWYSKMWVVKQEE